MGTMHSRENYPKWDLLLFNKNDQTGVRREYLGVLTELEQFLDHFGSEAKPSRMTNSQQLAIIKHGLYQKVQLNRLVRQNMVFFWITV